MIKKGYLRFAIYCLIIIIFLFVFFRSILKLEENNTRILERNLTEEILLETVAPAVIADESKNKPEFSVEEIKNEGSKKSFDKKVRQKLIELLDMPSFSLKEVLVTGYEDRGSYIERTIILITTRNTGINAYLLIPKGIDNTKKAPAVIANHGHGGFYEYGKDWVVGKKGDDSLFYGKELAERGYVVIASDSPLFGKRGMVSGNNSLKVTEEILAQSLFVLGKTFLGIIVKEDSLVLDYLQSLDFVDKENIGCIGQSLGGNRCTYLSAIDKRVKATAILNSVSKFRREPIYGITRTWLTLVPGIGKFMEKSEVLGLILPRPIFILHTENDPIFPFYETLEIIGKLDLVYKNLGKSNNFEFLIIKNESHSFPKKYHEQVYSFFDKHLRNMTNS